MHDASLHGRGWECGRQRFRKGFQTIHDRNEHILYSAVLHVVQYRQQEFRAFRFAEPHPEDWLHALVIDPNRQIHRTGVHRAAVPNLDVVRVRVHDRVTRFKRALSPALAFIKDLVGDRRNEFR